MARLALLKNTKYAIIRVQPPALILRNIVGLFN